MNGSIPNGFAHSASRLENGDVHQYADITTPLIRGVCACVCDVYPLQDAGREYWSEANSSCVEVSRSVALR